MASLNISLPVPLREWIERVRNTNSVPANGDRYWLLMSIGSAPPNPAAGGGWRGSGLHDRATGSKIELAGDGRAGDVAAQAFEPPPVAGHPADAARLRRATPPRSQLHAPRAPRPHAPAHRARPRGVPPARRSVAPRLARPDALPGGRGPGDAAHPGRPRPQAPQRQARLRETGSTAGRGSGASSNGTSSVDHADRENRGPVRTASRRPRPRDSGALIRLT